jgi:REP element-mobilizing transposase RayT
MPRQARVVAVGVPHPITHRGNNRQDVFLSGEDRRRYQNLLRDELEPCAIELLGWCWMTNPIHRIAIPQRPDSAPRVGGKAHPARLFAVRASLQPKPQKNRPSVAQPFLFLRFGGKASANRPAVRGPKPAPRRAGRRGDGISLVERKRACQPGR